MGRRSPFFGVLALFGFVAVHACSSDEATTGGGKKGGGGSGGSGETGGAAGAPDGGTSGSGSGKGGTGPTGGAPTGGKGGTAGTAGQAGEPSGGMSGDSGAGAGGQGGEGAVGPGNACTMCMDDSATVLQQNCGTSPSCTRWMACVRGCSDPDCLDACDTANQEVAPYRFAIYEALCDACATPCAALELCDRDCTDNINLVPTNTPPANLAATGLYEAPTATPDQVAPYARPFHPKYELWSDGAQKRRWAYIPRCSRIGTEGMNHWLLPVGTRMWKEFVIPASTGGGTPTRVETRFIHKFGAGDNDWLYATYQWPMNTANPTAADATLVDVPGVMNANGTEHDIPARTACPQCHSNGPGPFPDKLLGFSAIQLSHNEAGVTIRALADAGFLTFPAAAPGLGGGLARDGYNPPGTADEQQALGYLHANCGNCHSGANVYGQGAATPPARMRLMVGSLDTLQETDTYATLVDVPTTRAQFTGCDRIEPGFPQFSEIVMRMGRRDTPLPGLQMPPLATEQVHTPALNAIRAWINAMPNAGQAPTTCTPPP